MSDNQSNAGRTPFLSSVRTSITSPDGSQPPAPLQRPYYLLTMPETFPTSNYELVEDQDVIIAKDGTRIILEASPVSMVIAHRHKRKHQMQVHRAIYFVTALMIF